MAPSSSAAVNLSGVEFKLAGIEVESEVLQQRVLHCCEALAGHARPQGGDTASLLRAAEEALQSLTAIVHSLCEENLVLERRAREEAARSLGLEVALTDSHRGERDDGLASSPQTQPDGGWSMVLEEPSFANSFVAAPEPDRQQCEQAPQVEVSFSAPSGGSIPEQLRSIVAALEQARLAYSGQQGGKESDGCREVIEAQTQTAHETSWEGAKRLASFETSQTSWEPTVSWEASKSWEPAKKSQGHGQHLSDVQSPCHWSVSSTTASSPLELASGTLGKEPRSKCTASGTLGKERDPLQLAMESLHQTKVAVAVKSGRSLGRHL